MPGQRHSTSQQHTDRTTSRLRPPARGLELLARLRAAERGQPRAAPRGARIVGVVQRGVVATPRRGGKGAPAVVAALAHERVHQEGVARARAAVGAAGGGAPAARNCRRRKCACTRTAASSQALAPASARRGGGGMDRWWGHGEGRGAVKGERTAAHQRVGRRRGRTMCTLRGRGGSSLLAAAASCHRPRSGARRT